MQVGSLGQEDPLEETATHPSFFLENTMDKAGYSPRVYKDLDITERLSTSVTYN